MRRSGALYDVEIAETWSAIEAEWQELGSLASPFQAGAVLRAWYETLGRRADVAPLCLRVTKAASGETAMLLPLILRRAGRLRYIEFADLWAMDNNAPALGPAAPQDRAEAQAAFEAIRQALPACDALTLAKMPARIGGRANPLALLGQARPSDYTRHLCAIEAGWDEVLRGFDAGLRKNIQRQRRLLEQLGPVRFFTAEDAACRAATFELIETWQSERLAKLNAKHVFDKPEHRSFYRRLVQLEPSSVVLAGIASGGETIAASMLVCADGVAICLRHGYRQGAFERLGLGMQIIAHTIRIAHERGLRKFDHSIGDSRWKRDLGAMPERLVEVRRAMTVLGYAHAAKRGLRRVLPVAGRIRRPAKT